MTPTQSDREAAANVAVMCGWSGTIRQDMLNGTCEAIRHEYGEQVALIEAFAAHRIASTAAKDAEIAALKAEVAKARLYADQQFELAEEAGEHLAILEVAHSKLKAEVARLRDRKVEPRPYPYATADGMKYSECYVFDGGSLTVRTGGSDEQNGTGWLYFPEDALELEADRESSKNYWVANLANSELMFLRDTLNTIFPAALTTPAPAASDVEPVAYRYVHLDYAGRKVSRYGSYPERVNGHDPIETHPLYTHPPTDTRRRALPDSAGICAFDLDECTVTIALDNEDEVRALRKALPGKNRVPVTEPRDYRYPPAPKGGSDE